MSEQDRTILLVEDESIIGMHEALMIERHGYGVITAQSGETAVTLVESRPEIDLILMDIDVGAGMDGTEAAQQILEIRELPIVFLTSHSEQSMVDRVRGITRYGYVMKNAGEFVLMQSIAMAFELFESHVAMQSEIDHRRRTEEELRNRNRFIETILDNLPIGLAVNYIDAGSATYMNRKFQKIYGWPREAITDIASFFELVYPDPEYRSALKERILADLESGDPEHMEWTGIEITRQDGSHARVHAKNIPLVEQNLMISTVQDVTASARTDEERRDAIRKLNLAIETAGLGIWSLDVDTGRLTWNDEMHAIYGLESGAGPLSVAEFERLVYPEDLPGVTEALNMIKRGEHRQEIRFRIVRPNGEVRHVLASGAPVVEKGTVIGVIGINIDETDVQRDRANLTRLLDEQKLLLRETNHRIKNNLLTVVELINFAEASSGIELTDVKHQLDAIRSVHELLLDSGDTIHVEARPLVRRVVDAAVAGRELLSLTVRVDEAAFAQRIAVPVGLLVNELVTNAVRHGTSTGHGEKIEVSLEHRDAVYRLEVANTGKPFPDDVDPERPSSLGLRLVRALVTQLSGTMRLVQDGKTRMIVEFPDAGEPGHALRT